jgi:membrane protein YqaA with SNARE-associated domain
MWMRNLALEYGYLGIFAISLIGALSIFFPLPYTVVIFWLGGREAFDPFLIAIVAGIGSAVGEFSGYLLGFYGRRVIGTKRRKKMEFIVKVFDRFGPFAIFLFALTPLPDDLLFIPLGVMQYSISRALIPALIGKICMNFTVAYGGRLANQIIKTIFGEGSDWMAFLLGGLLGIILFIIVMVIMFKIDWEKILSKYIEAEEKKVP